MQANKVELKIIRETVSRKIMELPTLRRKQEADIRTLSMLNDDGLPFRAKVVQRFTRSGVRLDEETIYRALVKNLEARIASQDYEIERIENALDCVSDDRYYNVVFAKFVMNMDDASIADGLGCSESTVRKNRVRLLELIAVFLFGSTGMRQEEDII